MKPWSAADKALLKSNKMNEDKYVYSQKVNGNTKSVFKLRRDFRRSILRNDTLLVIRDEMNEMLNDIAGTTNEIPANEVKAHKDTVELVKAEMNVVLEKYEDHGPDSSKHITKKVLKVFVDEEDMESVMVKVQWDDDSITTEKYENLKNNVHLKEYWAQVKAENNTIGGIVSKMDNSVI